MKRMMAKIGGVLVLACALVVANAGTAEAAFKAYICNDAACSGGGDIIVTDEGFGDFAAGAPGDIVLVGSVGGFSFILNAAKSKPAAGSASEPVLSLAYSASGSGEAWIYATDDGFTGGGHARLAANSTLGGPTQEASGFGGSSNLELDLSNLLVGPLGYQAGIGASGVSSFILGGVSPYSLSVGVHLKGSGPFSGDVTLQVPEPASLTLFGLGLLGLGGIARRRLQANRA